LASAAGEVQREGGLVGAEVVDVEDEFWIVLAEEICPV
jgi:hypothetical protein